MRLSHATAREKKKKDAILWSALLDLHRKEYRPRARLRGVRDISACFPSRGLSGGVFSAPCTICRGDSHEIEAHGGQDDVIARYHA